jgi:hypothetical protein
MTLDIASYRLQNQHLSQADLQSPAEVVNWLGAVQSQDFAGAKWAIGLRTSGLSEADVERAFADGSILRTHVMRPTWHFVTPEDIHWMLALTAPRVRTLLAYNDRRLELNRAIINKSNKILTKTLQGGKQMTRLELGSTLQSQGINTDELRLTHLMIHAELDAVICSGGRRGKQFTYALLEERAAQNKTLERQAAVAELTRRYFKSHGPAALKDFVWWSGLSVVDAKLGIEAIKSEFDHEIRKGETYWFTGTYSRDKKTGSKAYFLPNYDEYTVGYTDRSAIFDAAYTNKLDSRGSVLAQHVILTAGQIVASWKRELKKNLVEIEVKPFRRLRKSEMKTVIQAAERYALFLGLPFALTFEEAQSILGS